jgi:hypothetical protein
MIDITDLKGWLDASKTAVDLLKSAYTALPKTPQRDEIESRVRNAEEILRRSDAALAHQLGYKLCRCTFPPQIMLWQETRKLHVCPNPDCGRTINPNPPPLRRVRLNPYV